MTRQRWFKQTTDVIITYWDLNVTTWDDSGTFWDISLGKFEIWEKQYAD